MAETTTVARPYARAAFELAQAKKGGLKRWSDTLRIAAVVAADENMRLALASPRLSTEEKADLFLGICAAINDGKDVFKDGRNFIKLLAENHRLYTIPEIATIFEELRKEAEKSVQAQIISAYPITDAQRNSIAKGLKAKLNRDVVLECAVDESLISGAIIRAGDLVIDGSARGQLAKLATTLRQ
jgi:F-type H+-transporting ATPase subunit delta